MLVKQIILVSQATIVKTNTQININIRCVTVPEKLTFQLNKNYKREEYGV